MAEKAAQVYHLPGVDGRKAILVRWTLKTTDTGIPVKLPAYPERTIQVYGTPGAAAQFQFEGSNDFDAETTTWAILTDIKGDPIQGKDAAFLLGIGPCPLQVRPNCTGGDVTTELTVILYAEGR